MLPPPPPPPLPPGSTAPIPAMHMAFTSGPQQYRPPAPMIHQHQPGFMATSELYPHTEQGRSGWPRCPAPHKAPKETKIYECCVIRRTRGPSDGRLSWKNPPHVTAQWVSDADIRMLQKHHSTQRRGQQTHAMLQYDRLKHSAMRDAVDYAVESRNMREADNANFQWLMVLLDVQQAPVRPSLFPSSFETTQIRIILQRVQRPVYRETFRQLHHPSNSHVYPEYNVQHHVVPQPTGIAAPAASATVPQISQVPWDHENVGHDTKDNAAHSQHGSSDRESVDGKSKTRGRREIADHRKKNKPLKPKTLKNLEEDLRGPPSDSASEDERRFQVSKKKHLRRADLARSPVRARKSSGQASRAHSPAYSTYWSDSAASEADDDGYVTPPTSSSDHSPFQQGRYRSREDRSRSRSRHQERYRYIVPVPRGRNYQRIPPAPSPPLNMLEHRRREADSADEREKLAYIAGRQRQRQLDDQMSHSSWPM